MTVVAGTTMTVSVTGGPANPTDWVALFPANAPSTGYVDWRYLSNSTVAPTTGLTSATLTFQAPVTPGDYECRFFANDGYAQLATSSPITLVESSAQLTVNAVSPPEAVPVSAGASVAVVIVGGPANRADWVGLYQVGTSDGAPLQWFYLNGTRSVPASGVPFAELTFGMPTSAGSYEFRFFANNSYARLATSTTVLVAASPSQLVVNGVEPPNPVTVPAGSVAVVTVSSGPGNATDWVALYPAGAATSEYIDWRYLNDTAAAPATGVTAATLRFTLTTTPGTYEFRFFADNGYSLLATSSQVTVPAPTAQIAVHGTLPPTPVTVAPGTTVSIAVSGGPGNPADWVGLAPRDAPNSAYLTWQYLNGTTTPGMSLRLLKLGGGSVDD